MLTDLVQFIKCFLGRPGDQKEVLHETMDEDASKREDEVPRNQSDPWSFVLQCIIGNIQVKEILCNHGSRIKLIPLYLARKPEGSRLRSHLLKLL